MLAAPSPPEIQSKLWRIIPFQKKGNQQSKNVTFFSAILLKMYDVTRSENRPLLSAMILVTQASLVLDHYLEDYLEDQGLVWSQGIQNASGDLGRLVAPPLCHRRKFDTAQSSLISQLNITSASASASISININISFSEDDPSHQDQHQEPQEDGGHPPSMWRFLTIIFH